MWRAFHRMRRDLDRGLERQLAQDAGLSSADFEVWVPVSEAADRQLRARDLVRILSWDRSRLSHHLRRMESRGLIERRDCPGDARGTVIALTPAGWSLIQAAAPAHVAAVRSYVFDVLTPADVRTFAGLAERITDRIALVTAAAGADADEACETDAGGPCPSETDLDEPGCG